MTELFVFCDVDGVLNRWDGDFSEARPLVDDCLIQFRRIIEKTGARTILSSSWRRHQDMGWDFQKRRDGESTLAAAFERLEIPLWIDRTPRHLQMPSPFARLANRPFEILTWLYENREKYKMNNFIALDDENNMMLYPHNIQTRPQLGLTPEVADEAIAFLQRPYHQTTTILHEADMAYRDSERSHVMLNGRKWNVEDAEKTLLTENKDA